MYVSTARLKKEDYPVFFFMFSILLFGLSASLIMDHTEKEDLYEISGVVESFECKRGDHRSGSGPSIRVRVNDKGFVHHLVQSDFSKSVPKLKTLEEGDEISALVASDSLGRDTKWLWEISRNGELLLSYEQTSELKKQDSLHIKVSVVLLAAVILLGISIKLWIKNRREKWVV